MRELSESEMNKINAGFTYTTEPCKVCNRTFSAFYLEFISWCIAKIRAESMLNNHYYEHALNGDI